MPDSFVSLEDVLAGARFLTRLPAFLRHPIGVEEARAILRRRLEDRQADFLALANRAIYGNPGSPYRQLLALAGCEYGDLERLVGQEGVEGALGVLFRRGVYLTVDEFKGRQPAVRGSAVIPVDPARLRNPGSASHVPVRSSGSRGPGIPVPIDLAFVRDGVVNACLWLEARSGAGWLNSIWGVPGSMVMIRFLEYSGFGASPVRWFSQVDAAAPGLHSRYRWSTRFLRWGSLLAGVPLPRPFYVAPDNPLPIARWMEQVLLTGGTPHLHTFASSAVRVCAAALEAGLDLRGARFTMSGEPTTAARLAAVRRTGAEAVPRYGSSEAGSIGHGCLAPETADDVHLLHDRLALIQAGPEGEVYGLRPTALLISLLSWTAPMIMLNVSMGDQATVVQRQCGCPLERLGWTTHLHTIRSYEKLTGGGMTFFDRDVIRVLDEVLPARFGGGPTDYQLLEEETAEGQPLLRLLVRPEVGSLETDAVAEAFLAAISAGSGAERVMGLLWRDAGFLRVERRVPVATASGKILHFHVRRHTQALTGAG